MIAIDARPEEGNEEVTYVIDSFDRYEVVSMNSVFDRGIQEIKETVRVAEGVKRDISRSAEDEQCCLWVESHILQL